MWIRGHEYRVDWTHLIFVTFVAAFILWYLLDARSVSLGVNNLLLVQPLAIFALIMYLVIVPQCFRRADLADEPEEERAVDDPLAPALPKAGQELLRVGVLGVALGLFVFSLNIVGFDIAIWLFALVTMAVCGERRPIPLILYPLAVTLVAVYGFRALMPYPMATTIL
jgi:Tripartite tricarboxylate transporter TctB family